MPSNSIRGGRSSSPRRARASSPARRQSSTSSRSPSSTRLISLQKTLRTGLSNFITESWITNQTPITQRAIKAIVLGTAVTELTRLVFAPGPGQCYIRNDVICSSHRNALNLVSSRLVVACTAYTGIVAINTAKSVWTRGVDAVVNDARGYISTHSVKLLLCLSLTFAHASDHIMYGIVQAENIKSMEANDSYGMFHPFYYPFIINAMCCYAAATIIHDAYNGRIMSQICVLSQLLDPDLGLLGLESVRRTISSYMDPNSAADGVAIMLTVYYILHIGALIFRKDQR